MRTVPGNRVGNFFKYVGVVHFFFFFLCSKVYEKLKIFVSFFLPYNFSIYKVKKSNVSNF